MALCAVATEAAAQPWNLTGSGGFGRAAPAAMAVENRQVQTGDVSVLQSTDVVHATGHVSVSANAQGNTLSGAVRNDALALTSEQTTSGDITAEGRMGITGEVQGPINLVTQAGANRLEASAHQGELAFDARQGSSGDVFAISSVEAVDGRALQGGYVAASALGNTMAIGGDNAWVEGSIEQERSGRTTAHVQSDIRYVPDSALYAAQAIGNAAASTVTYGGQQLEVSQTTTGAGTYASASVSSGNAWDIAGKAHAAANQATLRNQGGSLVVAGEQRNDAYVRSAVRVNAYDYGAATAYANGAGNVLDAVNNDAYLKIDNSQINSGGVEVVSTFTGHNGYDVMVGADAAGNRVTGAVCATCPAEMVVNNNQVNSGDVSAQANAHVTGTGRSLVGGANAVGNAATFYVSRPGH